MKAMIPRRREAGGCVKPQHLHLVPMAARKPEARYSWDALVGAFLAGMILWAALEMLVFGRVR